MMLSLTAGRIDRFEYNHINIVTGIILDGDNLTGVSYPEETAESFTYDANDNNLTAVSKTGIQVVMEYDSFNRLTQKEYADGNIVKITNAAGYRASYSYDSHGYNTGYDVAGQMRLILAGETNVLGLAFALAKGMVVQALLNCALTAVLGETAVTVLKVIGIVQDTGSFIETVKSGDPEKIIVESLWLAVSVFALSCQCFTGDTLVSTEDGDRRIDEIESGDKVWSYNTETGEKELKEVKDVSVTETDILVKITTTDDKEIETTMFHPFYVTEAEDEKASGMWVAASNLVSGDELLMEDGQRVYVKEVKIEKLAEKIKVYNLEVDEWHTYFVAGGVLVHNRCGNTSGSESGTETDLFLPDEFYNKNLPNQVAPGTKYLPKYDELGNVKQIKMYDDYGREIGWVDYTNHGYGDINSPHYHTTPHWHEKTYNAQYPDGIKINHRTDVNTPLGDK